MMGMRKVPFVDASLEQSPGRVVPVKQTECATGGGGMQFAGSPPMFTTASAN